METLEMVVRTLEDADTCVVIRQIAGDAIEIAARELSNEGEDSLLVARLKTASDLLHRVNKVVARAYASAEAAADDGDTGSKYEMALIHSVSAAVSVMILRLDVTAERMS